VLSSAKTNLNEYDDKYLRSDELYLLVEGLYRLQVWTFDSVLARLVDEGRFNTKDAKNTAALLLYISSVVQNT
jgi:hypothetical protein